MPAADPVPYSGRVPRPSQCHQRQQQQRQAAIAGIAAIARYTRVQSRPHHCRVAPGPPGRGASVLASGGLAVRGRVVGGSSGRERSHRGLIVYAVICRCVSGQCPKKRRRESSLDLAGRRHARGWGWRGERGDPVPGWVLGVTAAGWLAEPQSKARSRNNVAFFFWLLLTKHSGSHPQRCTLA